MGSPKALLGLEDNTFIGTICSRLWEAGMDEVIVVLGSRAGEIEGAAGFSREMVVVNREFARGQLSSLRCGILAMASESQGALVTLVDHPLVSRDTYSALRGAWEAEPGKIIAAVYGGRGGHPIIFPRSIFGELLEAPESGGARAIVRKDPGRVVRLECDDPGIVADIDSIEDYKRFIQGV